MTSLLAGYAAIICPRTGEENKLVRVCTVARCSACFSRTVVMCFLHTKPLVQTVFSC